MPTLPVGDKDPNRQSGFGAARQRKESLGWRVLGAITRKISKAERDGRDIGQRHDR